MVWVVLIVVAVVLVAVFAALVIGRLPYDPMAQPVHTTPSTGLPERPGAADLDAVRFDTAVRGYRMSEVDDVLDGLQERLAAQEEELALLRAARGADARGADAGGADAGDADAGGADAGDDVSAVPDPSADIHPSDQG